MREFVFEILERAVYLDREITAKDFPELTIDTFEKTAKYMVQRGWLTNSKISNLDYLAFDMTARGFDYAMFGRPDPQRITPAKRVQIRKNPNRESNKRWLARGVWIWDKVLGALLIGVVLLYLGYKLGWN